MGKFVILSAAVHAILLLLLSISLTPGGGTGREAGDGGHNDVKITIIDKSEAESHGNIDKDCEHWYGGVGIISHSGVVTHVALGYPAHKAGIRKGDYIMADPEYIRGEIGTTVRFSYIRDDKITNVELVREKICEAK